MTRQRARDRLGIGIRSTPLAGLLPDRVYGPDAARQRIDDVEISQHLLLVRNGNAESGNGQAVAQREEILELLRMNQKWQIHRIEPARLECTIVNRRRNGVPDGIGNDAVNLRPARELLDAIEMTQQ